MNVVGLTIRLEKNTQKAAHVGKHVAFVFLSQIKTASIVLCITSTACQSTNKECNAKRTLRSQD
jgi:hypothetical protein